MKKYKLEEIPAVEKDGTINIGCTLANDDWIRAHRLKKRAEQGDKEAEKELEKMHNTRMVRYVPVEDEENDE